MGVMAQGWSFAIGMHRTLRDRVTLDDAIATVTDHWKRRDERFIEMTDRIVWPFPQSPHHRLLDHAGIERGDLVALVASEGLDAALGRLVQAGVYVAHEEYVGRVPATRGSAT